MENNQFTNFTSVTPKPSPKRKAFIYVVILIFVIAAAMVGANMFFKNSSVDQDIAQVTSPTPTIEVTPTATPEPTAATPTVKPTTGTTRTPTPSPSIKTTITPTKTGLTVRVLNGSGEKGAAGDLASVLLDAGYTVDGTGNADTFDYTDTVIQIKKSKQAQASSLQKALATDYTVAKTVETLAESATVDAIVIVGTN